MEDLRVDIEIDDPDGRSLETLLGSGLPAASYLSPEEVMKAKRLFKEARTRRSIRDGTLLRKKGVIFVINYNYEADGYDDLEGPERDLDIAKTMFEAKGYYVIDILEDTTDINQKIVDLIDAKEAELGELDVLQFVYSGEFL